jgi:ABC-type transport system involved in multi-copper enzyme maturation permease subunit
MLPGPVFHAELLTTARRARYYAIRTLYVLALLFVLWSTYESTLAAAGSSQRASDTYPIAIMNKFGASLFRSFAIAQAITVAALTPALVAGTIATEKQRKTLHYLLGSQLTSREIVLGKLCARFLHIGVFVAMGLPIFSLLTLFGGVDFWLILGVYGLTLSGAFFLAGLSVYASVVSRRGRDAILLAYGLVLLWCFLPFLFGGIFSWLWPNTFEWVWPVGMIVYPGLGIFVAALAPQNLLFGIEPWVIFCWSMGLMVLYGAIFVAIASWRLRPIAVRHEAKPRMVIGLDNRGRRQYRVLPRPSCSDTDPMLWKERYTARMGGLIRLLTFLAGLCILTLIGCLVFDIVKDSCREMLREGFFSTAHSRNREEMNHAVRTIDGGLISLWILCTAAAAASSISGEREEDTWISLTSTMLTGREILRAKRWGAIVRYRLLGYVMGVLSVLALMTGAVHPLGLVGAAVLGGVVLWFTASLGTYVSLRSKSTIRALAVTVVPLVILNGGYLLCCISVPEGRLKDAASNAIIPRLMWASFLTYSEAKGLQQASVSGVGNTAANPYVNGFTDRDGLTGEWLQELSWCLWFYVFVVPLYALAARVVNGLSLRHFPRAVGRPTKPGLELDWNEEAESVAAAHPDLVPSIAGDTLVTKAPKIARPTT